MYRLATKKLKSKLTGIKWILWF